MAAPTPNQTLIGRDAELEEITSQLGIRAVSGSFNSSQPPVRAVLLSGDAGVGKTRLLTELRDVAFTEGWQVVAGHCLDFGDSALPYLPFSEVLGRLATDLPDIVAKVAADQPALNRLLPGRRVMTEGESGDAATVDRGDIFDAVHALLETAAEAAPLLLVIEDTHWADRSTRDMLSFLFSRPFARRVAIVASYRSDDLHRRHPLRTAAAEWARIPGVGRLQLAPLGTPAVRALVKQLHPDPLLESDVADIVDRAEGNAFFVEELVNAAWGGGLPEDLAGLLLVRLDRLDDAAQRVVRAAAVAGRRVSHPLLASVVSIDDAALEQALRHAVETNVLVPARGDGYAFRHALLAEAVYDDLLPGERVRLHAAFARVLSESQGQGQSKGTAAELARHARAAHDLPTALRASIDAGDDAFAVGGPDEAAQHYELALDLLADERLAAEVTVDMAALVSRTAESLIVSGHPDRGLSLIQAHLAALPDDASPTSRGHLLFALANTVMVAETRLDALELTTEALAHIPDEMSALRAKALASHARALAYAENEQARPVAVEALAMAESLDMPHLASEVMTTLVGLENAGDDDAVIEALDEVVKRAAETGAVYAELRGLYLLGRRRLDRGQFAGAREAFQRAVVRAEETSQPWAPYGFDARFMDAQVAYLTGAWDDVLRLTDVSGQQPPIGPESLLAALELMVHVGRGADAVAFGREVRPHWDKDGLIAITAGSAMIDAYGNRGDAAAAVREHDDLVTLVSGMWRSFFHARVRLAALAIGALASSVEQLSAAEREQAAADVARLRKGADCSLELIAEERKSWGPEGQAWAARLEAETLRFRWRAGIDAPSVDELVTPWTEAVRLFGEFGHRFELARSQARLAAVLRASGDLAAARVHSDPARATAHELGAQPLLDELQTLGGTATPRAEAAPDTLTPREKEILALVAIGRSNGEIGKQLFISTKTVSVHVSNILGKLGASGRTEAAAIARRRGLLD
ncbi:helix-turn-helix transcriptional regulator [Nocardioides speluncae]|uniref:helix-turn-helix transcriptional regulator n=1 Tax=Nocardioides speluncae TaxID=2670337 RepID=UPI00137AF455|nr:AAA family ATPase [Nocardioides speluncae]